MDIIIRPLEEGELAEADRIFRLAFGTFLGLPDPLAFAGDADYVHTRWRADPSATFAALEGGELLGTNFATRWGSFAFFGPLTVRPDRWDTGVARRLLDATMARFDAWGVHHAGLFTFAQSAKHVGLYQRFGFHPRFLTAIMAAPVGAPGSSAAELFSARSASERAADLGGCAAVAGAVYPGLDLSDEIRTAQTQALGDTVLLREDGTITGFAVCHVGPGTEAGSGTCYLKFAAALPGDAAAARFQRLLDRCTRFAADRGAAQLVAGVNTAREPAYRHLRERGFRTIIQGVAMQRPNEAAFNSPDAFVIDDWR